jgi:hypothetical protein
MCHAAGVEALPNTALAFLTDVDMRLTFAAVQRCAANTELNKQVRANHWLTMASPMA